MVGVRGKGEEIKKLGEQGYSYKQISKIIGCSTSAASYHIGIGRKEKCKANTYKVLKKAHPYYTKLKNFKLQPIEYKQNYKDITKCMRKSYYSKMCKFSESNKNRSKRGKCMVKELDFKVEDVIEKFGENPKCYLTGRDIDISKTRFYHFDHVIPRSKGGPNTLENLQISCKQANEIKRDMSINELFSLCKEILEYNGFEVNKLE